MFVILLVLFFLSSCYQKETNVVFKNRDGKRTDAYVPNYLKGSYVNHNNKTVRDLKAKDEMENSLEYKNEKVDEDSDDNDSETKKSKSKKQFISNIVVQKGDSLLFYSRKYNTTVEEIAKLNNLKKPYNIYIGQKLKIMNNSSDKEAERKNKNLKTIVVQPGDNLLKLSVEYKTTLREMAEINNLESPYSIYVGQKLKAPDFEKFDYTERKKENSKKKETSNKNYYVVEKGDNLFYVAKKHNVSVNDLIRINNLQKPYNIYLGQKLLLDSSPSSNNSANNSISQNKNKAVKTDDARNVEVVSNNIKNSENNFDWPLRGEVIRNFGDQLNGKSFDGILIKTTKGTEIKASDDGEVIYAGNELKDFGNIVIVKHTNNWLSIYGHCERIEVKVKNKVKKGETIAIAGKTGSAKDEQLYFAVRRGRVAVDPLKYLNK